MTEPSTLARLKRAYELARLKRAYELARVRAEMWGVPPSGPDRPEIIVVDEAAPVFGAATTTGDEENRHASA